MLTNKLNQAKLPTLLGLGAQESPLDIRDKKDEELTYAFPFPTIYKTDMSIFIPGNVKYQKSIGACTGSLTYYIEYLYWKKTGVYVKLSMAFLYLITKKYIDGNTTEGSSLRSALKAAQKYGVCTEATYPSNFDQDYSDFIKQIVPQKALDEAQNYKIGQYTSIPIEPSLLAGAIYKYGMLYARVSIGSEWYKPTWAQKDIDPLRPPKTVIGGHAIHIFGYDDSEEKTKNFLLNTWSYQWNNQGTGSFIYEDYLPYLTEAWVVTLNTVVPQVADNTPNIASSAWRKFLEILRKLLIVP